MIGDKVNEVTGEPHGNDLDFLLREREAIDG
jgi:hypothetical protein